MTNAAEKRIDLGDQTPLTEDQLIIEIPKLRQAFLSEIASNNGYEKAQVQGIDAEHDDETEEDVVAPGTFAYIRPDGTRVQGYSNNLFGFNLHVYIYGREGKEYVWLGLYRGDGTEDTVTGKTILSVQYLNPQGKIQTNTQGALIGAKSTIA